MLVACWSVKGGGGTTVVAAALAMVLASADPKGSTLVDWAVTCPPPWACPSPPVRG